MKQEQNHNKITLKAQLSNSVGQFIGFALISTAIIKDSSVLPIDSLAAQT